MKNIYPFYTICNSKWKLMLVIILTLASCNSVNENRNTNDGVIKCDDHFDVRQQISDWWETCKRTIHMKCKFSKEVTANKLFTVEKIIKVQEISTFPCKNENTYRPFIFNGNISDNQLVGSGKLSFITSKDWRLLSKEKQNKILAQRVCFTINQEQTNPIKEIIGKFRNGKLNGRSKIKYNDDSYKIGGYKNGKLEGFCRSFDSNDDLKAVGLYKDGISLGYHWSRKLDHIVYEDGNVISDKISPTIIFPILEDGSMADPMAGDYYSDSGVLEKVHTVQILKVAASKSNCSIDLKYELVRKEDYDYDLGSKLKVPVFGGNKRSSRLCEAHLINTSLTTSNPSSNLRDWVDYIKNQIDSPTERPKGHQLLWKMNQTKQLPNLKTSVKLISNFTFDSVSKKFSAQVLGCQPLKINFHHKKMKIDSDGKPNGYNDIKISYESFDQIGMSHLAPKDKALNWRPSRIIGMYHHGVLDGRVLVITNTSSYAWMTVQNGVLHGPCIISKTHFTLDLEHLNPFYQLINYPGIGFIGYYKDSKLFGTFWSGMIGGNLRNAFLHGKINEKNGMITGNDIAYIYPDMETVYLGKFENSKMIDAQESSILEVGCDENGVMLVKNYLRPNVSVPHVYYEPPTNISFGQGPKGVMDPYEKRWVELKMAENSKMGESAYAKKDFKNGELVAIYNAFTFKYKNGEFDSYKKRCGMNFSKPDEERRKCVKYSMRCRFLDAEIAIPPEHDLPAKLFPSLGPKVNHHFRKNNTAFKEFEHPRWGAIIGVYAKKDIEAGEELFAYYGYSLGHNIPNDHPWYWEAKRELEKEERNTFSKSRHKSSKNRTL